MPLLKIAEQIKFTTKAVELVIAHRLEDIKSKFKSMSDLEVTEQKITRRLTTHRNSKRVRNRNHRHSKIHESYEVFDEKEKVCTYQRLIKYNSL